MKLRIIYAKIKLNRYLMLYHWHQFNTVQWHRAVGLRITWELCLKFQFEKINWNYILHFKKWIFFSFIFYSQFHPDSSENQYMQKNWVLSVHLSLKIIKCININMYHVLRNTSICIFHQLKASMFFQRFPCYW